MQIKLVSFQLHLFKPGNAAVEGERSWHSAGQLIKNIWEQHSEDWLHRSAAYLTACEPFTGNHQHFQDCRYRSGSYTSTCVMCCSA